MMLGRLGESQRNNNLQRDEACNLCREGQALKASWDYILSSLNHRSRQLVAGWDAYLADCSDTLL